LVEYKRGIGCSSLEVNVSYLNASGGIIRLDDNAFGKFTYSWGSLFSLLIKCSSYYSDPICSIPSVYAGVQGDDELFSELYHHGTGLSFNSLSAFSFTKCEDSSEDAPNDILRKLASKCSISTLNISKDALCHDGCKNIATFLRWNKSVQEVHMEGKRIESGGCRFLVDGLAKRKIGLYLHIDAEYHKYFIQDERLLVETMNNQALRISRRENNLKVRTIYPVPHS